MLNSINPDRFFRLLVENPVRHQVNALSYAIAISGACLSGEFPNLKLLCYQSARQYLELAERQEDGTSFLNLESLQALLLILRYELNEAKCIERAWMTHGRAMTLAKLLHMDTIDASQVPIGEGSVYVPHETQPSLAEMDERRRTFWVAFGFDFFISALTNSMPTFQTSEVLPTKPDDFKNNIHPILSLMVT
jgi:hypothetical protein